MSDCPNEDELVRLIEGALDDASMSALEAHADSCEHCAAVIANLGALGTPAPITAEVRRRGAWPAAGPAVASQAVVRSAVRRNVGRYQLDRRIASGGMGEVWAAWDPQLRREIAVKLVRPERSDDGRERERLLREARALARFTHPNVIAVHDVGEVDGEVFLATELVIGDTLANRGGASADWRELARLYAQAARGLAAAHAAGLVHRDVKPANLLLGADGRVRVVDFGLAVRTHAPTPRPGMPPRPDLTVEPAITKAGYIAGTPGYMSPEQRAGAPADSRSDQFALCVALGEAIAGRRPPVDSTPAGLIEFVAERRAGEPALDALCAVIARGLSIDPDERYPDMTAIADAIDTLLAGPAAPAARARGRRVAMIVAILLAAALGGGAVWLATHRAGSSAGAAASSAADPDVAPPVKAPGASPPSALVAPPSATTPGATSSSPDAATSGAATSSGATSGAATAGAPSAPASGAAPTGSTSPNSTSSGAIPNARTSPGASSAAPPRKQTVATDPSHRTAPPAQPGARPPTPPGPAASAPPPTSPSVRPPPTSPSRADDPTAGPISPMPSSPSLADINAAIRRRDARACNAAIAAASPAMPNDIRIAGAHAICRMLGGDCDGGTHELEAVYTRDGTPASSAVFVADDYCPLTNDPITRRRRLFAQTTHFMRFECSAYVAPARAVAREATSDIEKRQAASVLATIAKCYSIRNQCDEARAILAEAQQLVPALGTSELAAQCR